MPCRYSSSRFPASIFAAIWWLLSFCWILVLANRMPIASGSATNIAVAMRQSIHSSVRNASTGITIAPINCGRWCEMPVSAHRETVMSIDDRSPGSRRDRNPSESLRRCSAREMRPSALIS